LELKAGKVKMYCLKCGGKLEYQHNDSREEWVEEYYVCGICNTDHTKKVDYQVRSSLIANSNLYIKIDEC
jgi:Cys-tRNA synthase (O-phospho-L-seryl-tRNA:Cys-tRNA synthase)